METVTVIEPQTQYTIRFGDCDPFGHLNNARYLDYIINAREDHLKQFYNLELQSFYKKGTGWVITSHEIVYLKPAMFNEIVTVQSSLIDRGSGHLMVEGIMFDREGRVPKAVMWTSFAYINLQTGRRETHPEDFMAFADEVLNPKIDFRKGLQARVLALRNSE